MEKIEKEKKQWEEPGMSELLLAMQSLEEVVMAEEPEEPKSTTKNRRGRNKCKG